ncbi:arylsulfatase [Xylariaceae sp. AK1471]|nr:arylsulfatase [Xylariaceae sp. AK1471]
MWRWFTLFLAVACCRAQRDYAPKQPDNIILIFTDDQDLHLGSLDHMPILQKELVEKGTQFVNHYATVALCCPSRASLLRGQAAHNTNITYVSNPGGNYQKWLVSEENEEYLPHWLANAGYNTEYLGKFLNGYGIGNYMVKPKGWSHTDLLVDPWTYIYNNVVMSSDGETPMSYDGYHQLDVIRVKALDRIDRLSASGKPFYLTIAPSAPHIEPTALPVPQVRHQNFAEGLQIPRQGNWNPSDKFQRGKPSWLKNLSRMNQSVIDVADAHYRARLAVLQGVDEIVEDVIKKLRDKGILDNTYIIYTTDNGYHLGNHRAAAGKSLPYLEDTNIPLIVRGPGVPAGKTSRVPSAPLDFPPTFLEIGGVRREDFPEMFDGRSLLTDWKNPNHVVSSGPHEDTHEIMNIEFWGKGNIESSFQVAEVDPSNSSYKTLRVVGEDHSYLYSRWCTNETELYNTQNDPFELHNLADNNDTDTKRLLSRLNALLLATKSCSDQTCRNPWKILQPGSLDQALNPEYDDHFNSIPQVTFQECLTHQLFENEKPYLPDNPQLGMAYRKPTDNYAEPVLPNPFSDPVEGNGEPQGGPEQRSVTLQQVMARAKELTKRQLGQE